MRRLSNDKARALPAWLMATVLAMGSFLVGQEDCTQDPPPKYSRNPLALDCVVAGNDVFIPLEPVLAPDRSFFTAGTGTFTDMSMTARVPADLFCALNDAGYSQVDLGSATVAIDITNVTRPIPPEVRLTATGLPITAIDTALTCGGSLGPEIVLDFPPVTTVPWADGDTVVYFLLTVPGIDIKLTNVLVGGSPVPDVSLIDLCEPTDRSTPLNGATDDPEDGPRIAADLTLDGNYANLAQPSNQILMNVNGYCLGFPCNDFNECTEDHCDPRNYGRCTYTDVANGTSCDFGGTPGACSAGTCVSVCDFAPCDDGNECTTDSCDAVAGCFSSPVADNTPCNGGAGACYAGNCLDGPPTIQSISVACGNNITEDFTVIAWDLIAAPDPILAGQPFNVGWDGVARFPELFLDAAQGAVPGGVTKVSLVDLKATVQVRGDGATGPDVALIGGSSLPYECILDDTGPGAQQPCDPDNDVASVPGVRGNTDCVPTGNFNPCGRIVLVPTSNNCVAGGTCDDLGKLSQCSANGFCVTGGLPLPLDAATGSYVAGDGITDALFGWFDNPPSDVPAIDSPFLNGNGTWNLRQAAYTGIAGPNGLAVNAGGLALQLECIMGTDAEDATPPISNASFPTPDQLLLSLPIGPPSWGTPELISDASVASGVHPRVAVDPNGNAVAVWLAQTDGSKAPWSNRLATTGGWGVAERIHDDDSVASLSFSDVAVDATGNAIAVWTQSDVVGWRAYANHSTPAAGWGAAQPLGGGAGSFAGNAHVAFDPNGNAMAVWDLRSTLPTDVYANRFTPSGGWETAEVIDHNVVDGAAGPVIAFDANGDALAAWIQSESGANTLWASRFSATGGWGTPERIDDDLGSVASGVQLAVDASGSAVAVWQQEVGTRLDIWVNHFTTITGWGTPKLIEDNNTGSARSPQVAADPSGSAIVVWSQSDASGWHSIWANRYTPAAGWGVAGPIENGNTDNIFAADIAMDARGNAVVVWTAGGGIRIEANHFTQATGWGVPQVISGSSVENPRVAVSSNGSAIAVWHHHDGSATSVWANRFE